MKPALPCPEKSRLERLRLGQLAESEASELLEHLEQCEQCVQTLDGLQGTDTLFDALRAAAAGRRFEPPSPEVEDLIDQFCQVPAELAQGSRAFTQHEGTRPHLEPSSTIASENGEGVPDFLSPAQAPDELGRLGPYRVLSVLGSGGMGFVFLAEDPHLRRRVALKAMKPGLAASTSARQRFLREARAIAAIDNDHIVHIYQVGEDRGVPFLAMQLLQGETLDDRLKREGTLPIGEALRIGREIAQGLAAAHERGLIHRDIKPANIWLEAGQTRGAAAGRVKVLDFGLARGVDDESSLTQPGAIAGTPAYMAPEQAAGEAVDCRSDLFSLGSVTYRMLTGSPPFQGKSRLMLVMAVIEGSPKPIGELRPDLPGSLVELVMKLLEKRPTDRPESALEVVHAIEAIENEGERTAATGSLAGRSLEAPGAGSRTTETVPAAIEPAEQPKASKTVPYTRRRWRTVVFVAFLLLGTVVAAQVYRVQTDKGTLVVEIADESVAARLRQNGLVIEDTASGRSFTIAAVGTRRERSGDYRVSAADGMALKVLSDDGLELATNEFKLARGGTVRLRITLEGAKPVPGPDASPATAASDPERRAAEWALGIGANGVWIELATGQVVDVHRAVDLPSGPFFVVRIDLWGRTNTANEALRNLIGLQRLNSFSNAGGGITDAGLAHFRELKTLQVLDIPRSQVSDAGLAHIKDLPDLKFLHIAGTRVTDGGMALLPAIATLETLNVEDTAISDAGLEHLLGMTSLRSLAIGGTRIMQAGLVRLEALARLEELLLRELPVTDAVLARLSGNASLKNLQLQKTLITDAGLIQLAKLPGLEHLSLEGTALTDAGLEPLTRLKKLAFLDLRGTKVTPEGIKKLHAAVPKCKLRSDYGTMLPEPESSPAGAPQAPRDLALDWSNPVVRLLKTSTKAHINSVVFTPDSRYLLSGDHASNVRIWEVTTGKELRSFIQEGDGHITCLDVSPDGRAIAVGKYKPVLQLRDWETGAVVQTLSGHTDAVIAARFSPDGKQVLTGSEDGTARLWEAASGMQMQIYQGHVGALTSAVFTGDGQKVVTASDFDRSIRVWDRATGKELKTITGLESVSSLATSRGSNLVLSAGGQTVAAFDPTTGEELRRWRTPVAVLGLSPDGRVALSAAVFRTHRLWEVDTGKLLWSIDGHAVNTWSQNAAFSPDGRHFASGDTEGVILLGRFNPIDASHDSTAPSDTDRQTAQWVLQAGGSLRVLVDGVERDVAAAADLPQSAFHVASIRFEWGNRRVADDHLKDLRSLRKLQGIVLGGCNITDAGVAHLAEIASLRELALDATQLTDAGLAHIARLTNLVSLTINGTRITDQGVEHLRALNQLKLLWISHTAVGDRGFQQLGSLANLQTLQAFETRLSDAGLVHLTGLKDLKQLTIGKTRVTAAGVQKLSSALPECEIESDHAVP